MFSNDTNSITALTYKDLNKKTPTSYRVIAHTFYNNATYIVLDLPRHEPKNNY